MNAAENTSFIYRARARLRNAPARSGQRAIRGGFLQPLARIRETRQLTTICRQFAALQPLARIREMRQRGVGNARFAAAFFNPSCASARRESAERETHDSRRLSSVPRARPRDAPARSGQRAIRGAFIQPLARIHETRKRGAGNARFAALSSAPRAHPRDAPARSGQHAIRGGFLQPLARLHETRKRGVGNARFAAAFFSPSRGSTKRESAERATRDSRRFHSAPRAHPRDAKARSGQLAIHGGFLQPLARLCETRKRGTGSA